MTAIATFDLRPLAPPQRHQLAFQCFDSLAVGDAFEFINDHEPRGLLLQFMAQRPGGFDWQVLQAGPEAWRIRVLRSSATAAPADPAARAGGCGGSGRCQCSGQ